MDLNRRSLSNIFARTDVRLACFGVAGVLSVLFGFIVLSVAQAEWFIRHLGYYVLLFTFVLWIALLWKFWQEERRLPCNQESGRRRLLAWAAIVLFTVVALVHETFRSKILNDEFVLQSTAFNMHFFREVCAMARGYNILGTFVSTDTFLDKRPNFYPFLVSLVHDFTGYRSNNAFYVNAALMPVALMLANHIGRRLTNWIGGIFAVILLGSLPIFAQNATGSGMEMLNVTMLLAAVALGARYIESPDETRLAPFLLAAVLLAQCRYESVLYVLPAGGIVLLGWWRSRTVILPWLAVLVPLLLVPVALHNKVLSNSPVLWEMKANQTSRFGWEYVPGNLKGAEEFLLSFRHHESNSVILTVIGAIGLVWVIIALVTGSGRRIRANPFYAAWFFFGLGILANTVLVMFYFWSSFFDPMAARFCLPFYLLLVFTAVIFSGWLDRRVPATVVLCCAALVCFLGFSIPKQSPHHYSRLGIDEIEWERRFVAARPPGEKLILANNSTIIWLLEKTPSILLSRARLVTDRLHYQLEQSNFSEILVFQGLRPTSVEGEHQIVVEDQLPPTFHLQLLAEKRFGTKISRISRLVAVDEEKKPASP